jgi:hypothetical protein
LQDEISRLKKERRQLEMEKSRLEIQNGLLLEKINVVKEENSHLKKECFSGKVELMKATEVIGAYKDLPPIYKVTDEDSIFQMVAAVLLHVMNIIMRKTQPVTRLRTLTQVIFQRELFGHVATERVLRGETRKYSIAERCCFFPGKFYKALT